MLRAILKYRHGSLPQKNKLSRELAKQAVTTKCRGYIYAETKAVSLKKLWISVPKKLPGGIRIQQSAGAPKALR